MDKPPKPNEAVPDVEVGGSKRPPQAKIKKSDSKPAKGGRSPARPSRRRVQEARKKRIKRPAETMSAAAAVAAVLVSLLGFEGPQAKEWTAALAGVIGVIPIGISKLVDWKRERDVLEAEKVDLMERAVIALEKSVDEGTSKEAVEAALTALDLDEREATTPAT